MLEWQVDGSGVPQLPPPSLDGALGAKGKEGIREEQASLFGEHNKRLSRNCPLDSFVFYNSRKRKFSKPLSGEAANDS